MTDPTHATISRHRLAGVGRRADSVTSDATRAPSHRLARVVLTLALATTFLLALTAAPAQASFVQSGSFGSADMNNPLGVAVNQSTHDVYVANLQGPGVDRFDSSGNLISPPSPFSDPSGSGIYTGAAVNPTNGHVYVIDAANQQIDTFDPATGALLSSFSVLGSGNFFGGAFTIVQLATDAAGNVYLPNAPNNEVQEFDSSGTLLHTFSGSGASALNAPTGVAVDASGNVWVADNANNRIEEFGPTGAFLTQIPSPGAQAVALDSSSHVFALDLDSADPCGAQSSPCNHVVEYSSAGAQVDDFGAGTIGPQPFGVITTLAVDDSAAKVYVADGTNNVAWVFAPQTSPPAVSAEHATAVTADSATLGATINPGGLDTTYRFEYTTDADFQANGFANATKVPIPDADIGSGLNDVAVAQHLQGLQAGTTYHYRVVATNSLDTTPGPGRAFTTQALASSGPDTCANAALRAQQTAAFLPDCRAYEQVSPADKGDGALPSPTDLFNLYGTSDAQIRGGFQASTTGDRFGYASQTPLPGSQAGGPGFYLASRGPAGWSSQSLIPPQAPVTNLQQFPMITGYSPDLSNAVLLDGGGQAFGGQDDPALVPGEPANNQNLFLRDNGTGSYQLIDVTPQGVTPDTARFEGASADYSHVVFNSPARLTPDALSDGTSRNLYQWLGGTVSLVGQIPSPGDTSCGGSGPACVVAPHGAELGAAASAESGLLHAVSPGGSNIYFKDAVGLLYDQLYVRENGTTTTEVSASQKTNGSGPGGTDPNGPMTAIYRGASPDGSKVLFTSCEQLTNDSTAASSQCPQRTSFNDADGQTGDELYQYDTAAGQLADLSVDHNADPNGADVLGVLGASADGSYVYFAANGVLAPGASPGHCERAFAFPQPGLTCNLYLAHNGTTTFVATLDNTDHTDWNAVHGFAARVTPDGTHLAFDSVRSLTGYDNTAANGTNCGTTRLGDPLPLACPEVFFYDAASAQLRCASCDPTGARPIGPSALTRVEGGTSDDSNLFQYLQRNLSDDGTRLLFDSSDALVPGDNNAAQDVYEYENGAPHLISSATGGQDSAFLDATPSGSDAFFETRSQLVGQDSDQKLDVYDARSGGGFPFSGSPPPCAGDACKSPPSGAPGDQTPGSGTASDAGNLTPNRQPAHTSKKCKKGHKGRRCRKHNRRANTNHGGSK